VTQGEHPPAPWRLGGPAVVVPALVPLVRAREVIPDDLQVVPVAPGRTLGGLIAVTYEPGSTLAYSELVVIAGLVRSGRRVGGWISHIWVDSQESVNGGRSIWKLPKELADFELDRPADGTQRFTARANGVTLVRIAAASPRAEAPLGSLVPAISAGEGAHWFTLGRSGMRAGPARVRVEMPSDSPFASLALRPSGIGIAGAAKLIMDAARRI
jgi:hypothetical protein